MLKFIPVDNKRIGDIFSRDDTISGYIGYNLEDNSECGYCAFRLAGYSMEILDVVTYDNDAETAEGLIRSALNYGGNRNVYIARYKAPDAIDVAVMLGFEDDNGVLTGDIPTLLKGSCCKGNKG